MFLFRFFRIIGAILIVLIPVVSWSQTEIRGLVVDTESGEGVAYASIGVPEQQIAVSAHSNGYFHISIQLNTTDHLEVSSVGYRKLQLPLSQIDPGEELTINLDPEFTLLSEVVVRGKALELDDVIKDVSKNRKIYLRDDPYLLNTFYRETLLIDSIYQGFTEAQGIFMINGYDPRYRNYQDRGLTYDLAQWKNMRRSDYPKEQYLRIGRLLKTKDYYLYQGPLANNNTKQFNYKVTDTTQYDGDRVLVISFQPPAGSTTLSYQGSMMVKEDDLALIGMKVEQMGVIGYLPKEEGIIPVSSTFEINFSLFNEQYHLKNVIYSEHYRLHETDHIFMVELIGQEFTNQPAPFVNRAQRAVLFSDMLNPQVNYDPQWWSDSPFSSDRVFTEAAGDMEDLEQQFQKHHQTRLIPLPEGIDSYEDMVNEQNILDFFMQY